MKLAIIFIELGPYHIARIKALKKYFDVVVISFYKKNPLHDWNVNADDLNPNYLAESKDEKISKTHLLNILEIEQPDVLLIAGYKEKGMIWAARWAKEKNKLSVLMNESTYEDKKRFYPLEKIKSKIIKQYFDYAIIGGKATKKYMVNLNFPKEKIFDGYDVVDNDFFTNAEVKINNEDYFLYVGRFSKEKNLIHLIKQYKKYRKKVKNHWKLILVGEGPQNLSKYKDEDIIFAGFKQLGELPEYYKNAKAFILPSISEPWGLVINEAMASGLPILASEKCGSAHDLIYNGVNGFIFNPFNDELSEYMIKMHKLDLKKMGEASLNIISEYSLDRFVDSVKNIVPSYKKILFLTNYFPRPLNQIMGCWALSQAQALKDNGIEVKVVSPTVYIPRFLGKLGVFKVWSKCPQKYNFNSLEVFYPKWFFYERSFLKNWAEKNPLPQVSIAWKTIEKQIYDIIRSFKPDIIFCNHLIPNGFAAMKIKKEFNIPYVVAVHDFDEINLCSKYSKRKKLFLKIINHSDKIITITKKMEKDFVNVFNSGNVTTIYNGIKIPDISEEETSRKKITISSAGVFYKRKGFPILIKAFSEIIKRNNNILLKIIGDGDEMPKVKKLIRDLCLEDNVELLGFLPRSNVIKEIKNSDFFVSAGWKEPFATVFLEAMSVGKPIIACEDGGIAEVIEDGVHGYLISPKSVKSLTNSIEKMILNPEKVKSMGQNARKLIINKLSLERNAKNVICLLNEITK